MTEACKRIVASNAFQYFVLVLILLAAVLVGMETYPSMRARYGTEIDLLNRAVLWLFVVEAALKMAQHGRRFHRYFFDPWNVFDFLIVVICFLPLDASYAAVLRLARIMRALRLTTALPQLQLLVGALIKSIPSMAYVGIMLLLNFYVYAVLGVFLFGSNDPIHYMDLQTAMLSLFRVVTLEDWTDVMYINMYGSDHYPGPTLQAYQESNSTGIVPDPSTCPGTAVGVAYFVSFVMFGTMIMLNLFVGVILNSMDEARAEQSTDTQHENLAAAQAPTHTLSAEALAIETQLDALRSDLTALRLRLRNTEPDS